MSLNYARELLKISISQLCNAIGFDTTSEIAIDILVDICERQFIDLAKQTSNLIQIEENLKPNFFDLLSILSEKKNLDMKNLQDYLTQFQSLPFSQQIIQFPHKKRNQFYLRIPPKDSQQVLERDQNEATDYIYDWLPLFPDQETPEQPTSINIDTSFDATIYNDPDKKLDKSDSHHPLTLLSFLSKNGDEPNIVPIGKRPNRSLPSILYRPRRIIEMEAAAAAAEKAKKEQIEKENNEKDQQQGPPPPLRLTITKPPVTNNDKPSLPIKKLITTVDGSLNKKPSSTPLLNITSPSINLGKKHIISPPINETHSQPNPPTNSTDSLPNDDGVLDLTKPSTQPTTSPIKIPTLKLTIKNVSNSQNTNNTENPPTATKKTQQTNSKPPAATHEKVNLKIRTLSLPLSGTNEPKSTISPIINLPIETRTDPIESSRNNNDHKINQDINQTNQIISSAQNSIDDQKKEKKKKKKHHHDNEQHEDKKFKKEQETNQMDTQTNNPTANAAGGGAIRLKIKLGKAPNPPEEMKPSVNIPNESEHRPNSIRLTLPIPPSNPPPINPTPHRRKSGKIKHVPQLNQPDLLKPIISTSNFSSLHEDNTLSIDDLPLGERTSPNKNIFNNIQTNLSQQNISTPITKKPKKKPTQKRPNNTVGVAVIEERRIHHDSQEKIWICPSCNRPDNGQEAMIACDLCDDWYHWECVGIVEEPLESIPWFCPKCHRSNSSTASAQGIKPSASSKAKRKRASALYQQKQQQQYSLI